MNAWLATVPTTNLRIVVTIGLFAVVVLVTVVRFAITGIWSVPPLELLGALVVWAGLDVAQFHLKRISTFAPNGAKATDQVET